MINFWTSRSATSMVLLALLAFPTAGTLRGAAAAPYSVAVRPQNPVAGLAPRTDPIASSTDGFVTRHGAQLLLHGRPYRYTGINYYYANDRDNMPNGGRNAGYPNGMMAKDLRRYSRGTDHRSKVLRVWFFQRQATLNGARDWTAFDHTLRVAARHNFKVIAVLTDQYTYTEGPYKDINFYRSGYRHDVWPTSTTDYRTYVKQVVNRYKNNPTIMAWQLVNEGKADNDPAGTCPSEHAAFKALYGFAQDMTSVVRAIDTNHLLSNGFLFNNCGVKSGTRHYARICDIPGNDFYELHDYTAPDFTMSDDAKTIIAEAANAGRPVIVGEVGVARSVGLDQRAQDLDARFQSWFRHSGVAGITVWVWNGARVGETVDHIYDIRPGDPSLGVLAKYGMAPPPA